MTTDSLFLIGAIDLSALLVYIGFKFGSFFFSKALDKESNICRDTLPKEFGKRHFRKEVVYSKFKPKNKEDLIAAKKWVRENYPFMSMKVEQE